MRKSCNFANVKFSPKLIDEAVSAFSAGKTRLSLDIEYASVSSENEDWTFDNISDFYSEYQKANIKGCRLAFSQGRDMHFQLTVGQKFSEISVKHSDREFIENIFKIFKNAQNEDKFNFIPEPTVKSKTVTYQNVIFDWKILKSAIDKYVTLFGELNICAEFEGKIGISDEEWSVHDLDEFFENYKNIDFDTFRISISKVRVQGSLRIYLYNRDTIISVSGLNKSAIEKVLSVFHDALPTDKRPFKGTSDSEESPRIFIGHGRNGQWEKLKSHLSDKHGFDVEAYETGNRAGHTIRDILENMAEKSTFAFLVLTGEDKTDSGIRARQNVIHECGLFQGKLGYNRAIMIVEHGIELASNFDGIQQLRFKRGRISEVFGDAVATIRREFGS